MAAAAKSLLDKRNLALARARFIAWWEGDEFDPDAVLAALEAREKAANDADPGAEKELFDEPAPPASPRLQALEIIWGAGRVRPGSDEADSAMPALVGAPHAGRIALLGAGHAKPVINFDRAFGGHIDVFEWRDETIRHLRAKLMEEGLEGRFDISRVDLDAHVWPQMHYEGAWSIDDFTYVGFPPHLAQQLFKMLRPGARAIVDCYVGERTPETTAQYASAFASAFAEPHIRAHGEVTKSFVDVGFEIEEDIDLTEDFQEVARAGFQNLATVLADSQGLTVATARELAWEAEAWRVRLKLLGSRQLERRRFKLRRRLDDNAAPASPEPGPKKKKKKKAASDVDMAAVVLKKVLKQAREIGEE